MQPVFASIRFLCYQKIYWRLSATSLLIRNPLFNVRDKMIPSPETKAKCEVLFTVNGETKKVLTHPMDRLLDVLRNELGLTGTKEGCGEGECGSCSVLMDGMLVNSCLIPVAQASGANIVTIEGMSAHALMISLQETFLECGGAQCGICTPGMILAAMHL